jgi:hypothetical protein
MHHLTLPILVVSLAACAPPETKVSALLPAVSVTPEQVAFGEVVPGLAISRDLAVLSSGRATLEISSIRLESEDGAITLDWTMPDEGMVEVPASETLELPLQFEPTDFVPYTASLFIESNDRDNPEVVVEISGEGVIGPQPDIAVSPGAIDYGTVTTGQTATEYILISNEGDGDLLITGATQSGSGAFNVVGSLGGQTLAPSGSLPVAIEYTPDGGLAGHAGTLVILSDDPDTPELSIELTGGEVDPDIDYPEARITGEDTVNPPELVLLDGSSSTPGDSAPPEDQTLSYAWSIVGAPAHSNASLLSDDEAAAHLDVDVAGDYSVQLIVTDATGASSAPAVHSVRARPVEELYIALTWDTVDSDLDLHVLPSGATWFGDEDLSYCNTETSWSTGTGTHSGDDEDGFGPETVTITDLNDTAFHIGVHYFSDNGGMTTEAAVTVFMNGELHGEVAISLAHNDFWNAGYIRIDGDEGTFVPSSTFPMVSDTRECEEDDE